MDLKAKILYGDDGNDILDQYITFTKVLDEQIRGKGRTQEAVAETIRICKDREVLKAYLESREREVIGIMMTLFDQEYLTGVYVKEQREEAREDTQKEIALRMYNEGNSADTIARLIGLSIDTVIEWISDGTVLA